MTLLANRLLCLPFFLQWVAGFMTVPHQHSDTPVVELDGRQQRHVVTGNAGGQTLRFRHLIPGETYALQLAFSPERAECAPIFAAEGIAETSANTLQFTASAGEMAFQVSYPCYNGAYPPPQHVVTLECQSCRKSKLSDFTDALAIIETDSNYTAENLVRDIFIGGDCFDAANIKFFGRNVQRGYFNNGLNSFGFNDGVILSTGSIHVASGPNEDDARTDSTDNVINVSKVLTPDKDLQSLLLIPGDTIKYETYDMASLEFDFTPTQTPVTFEFVFASEEYCEYVNSRFNDVFGFFVSGPGINGPFENGAVNVALVPGTQDYVTINSVNHDKNKTYFVNNTPPGGNLCANHPLAPPLPSAATGVATNELQFDGYTKTLVAKINVIPCQTYRIKLKIADVSDGALESAVFLRAGSFNAGGSAAIDFLVDDDPDADEIYEDCKTVKLIVDRVGVNNNAPLPITINVAGTATPSLDYSPLPPTVIIPAGQDRVAIPIKIYDEGILEGKETILVSLGNPCSCTQPEGFLNILDLPKLNAVGDTATLCGPGEAILKGSAKGGLPPYDFKWSTNVNAPTTKATVTNTSTFTLTVTDVCRRTATASAPVIVNALPVAELLPITPDLCASGPAQIQIKLSGKAPFTIVYSIDGVEQPPIDGVDVSPYFLNINKGGLYKIASITDNIGCQGLGQGEVLVQEPDMKINGLISSPKCANEPGGAINTTVTGGNPPYDYNWSGPQSVAKVADPANLAAGIYAVTVKDSKGCTIVSSFNILDPLPLESSISSAGLVDCENPSGGRIDLEVSGGYTEYKYKWSNGAVEQDPSNLGPGVYTVTVTDQAGCTITSWININGDFEKPIAKANADKILNCVNASVLVSGSGSSIGSDIAYSWTGSPGSIVGNNQASAIVVNQPGTYTLVVTDKSNGCTAVASVDVPLNTQKPFADAGPPQTLNCSVTKAALDGSNSSQGDQIAYEWSAGAGGQIEGGETSLYPTVSRPGDYQLIVRNTISGCTDTSFVTVNINILPPAAAIVQPKKLTCENKEIGLDGSGSAPTNNVAYNWTTVNGFIKSGANSPYPTVTEAGDYKLVITNLLNGCTDDASVTVEQDFVNPTAIVILNGQLDCEVKQLTLDGSQSSSGGGFGYEWKASDGGNIVSGQGTLKPVVNAPGTYSLVVTNLSNKCTSIASAQVIQNLTKPTAFVGPPANLNCINQQLTLGNPSAPLLPNLTYVWTATPGSILSGQGTPSVKIDQPGQYSLLVTDVSNNCTATASVSIGKNVEVPNAVAGVQGDLTCDNKVKQLSGTGSSVGLNFAYLWTTADGKIAAGATTLTPTVTAAGDYKLLVTNLANGCTQSASVSLKSNLDIPKISIAPPPPLNCKSDFSIIKAGVSAPGADLRYLWGTITGIIDSGQYSPHIKVSAPGEYFVVVTNKASGCTADATVLVPSDYKAPVANAGGPQTLNCKSTSLSLDGNGSTKGPNISYLWKSLTTGHFISPTNIISPKIDQPGVYELIVTDNQNGCTANATVEILRDANEPLLQVADPAELTCSIKEVQINATLNNTAGISLFWTGPGIVKGENTLTPTVNKPGDYTIKVVNNSNGCSITKKVTIPQDILPPSANAGPDPLLNCYTPLALIGDLSPPTGDFSYEWIGPGILSNSNEPSVVVDKPGIYTFIVRNNKNGCAASDQVIVKEDKKTPFANAGPGGQLTCGIKSIQLKPTASQGNDFAYAWTTNSGNFVNSPLQLAPVVNGVGFYFLTVTDKTNGCTASSQVQITQSIDLPIANAGIGGILTCKDTILSLNGSNSSIGAKFTHQWMALDGGSFVGPTNVLTPRINRPGAYQLIVTDTSNTCVAYSSVTVGIDVVPPSLSIEKPPVLNCAVSTVELKGKNTSNGAFSYTWSAIENGHILKNGLTLTPTVDSAGLYILNAVNVQNGCVANDSIQVLVDRKKPVADIKPPGKLTCAVRQLTLDASASSAGNYVWSTPNGRFINLSNAEKPIINQEGDYYLVITDQENFCVTADTIKIIRDVAIPTAEAGGEGLLNCDISSLRLNGNGSSLDSIFFYVWKTPDGQIIDGEFTLYPTIIEPGTYTLTVFNTDNGCVASDLTIVKEDVVPPIVAIVQSPIITCYVPEVYVNGSKSSNGSQYSQLWTTKDGFIVSGETTLKALVNAPGVYRLFVKNNDNGCIANDTTAVGEDRAAPSADAGPDFSITCNLPQIRLYGLATLGSIFRYEWSTPDGHFVSKTSPLNPVVDKQGRYFLTVTNTINGCFDQDSTRVREETSRPTDLDFTVKNPTCRDDDGVVLIDSVYGGVQPYVFSLDGGETYTTVEAFYNVAPGSYQIWVQDINGCEYSDSLSIPREIDPAVSLPPDVRIEPGDSLRIRAVLPKWYPLDKIDTIIWTPTAYLRFDGKDLLSLLNPISKPKRGIRYTITVISKDSCEATDDILIEMDPDPRIYIPNVIMPEDPDEDNAWFTVFTNKTRIKQVKVLRIFDRWGNMTFERKNFQPDAPRLGWNGYLGTDPRAMNPAVFVYKVEVELEEDNKILYFEGDVTVIR